MERSSYFIKNRAMFGSFPTQEAVEELENNGVRCFVNLTHSHERRITPYQTKYKYISFPITDHQVPEDRHEFSKLVISLVEIIYTLEKGELMYIHCKGGHGRSGVVVAAMLCYIFDMEPVDALEHTTSYHSNRKSMREKWRKIGSPQTYQQKNFIYQVCRPIYFYRAYKNGRTAGFSNFTTHEVSVPGLGVFPTAEAAIQAYKDPNNKNYVNSQIHARAPLHSKHLGNKADVRKDWSKVREHLTLQILRLKFDQHPYLKENLISTGLSLIVHRAKGDTNGSNILGKLLCRLRSKYYSEN